MPVKIRQTRSRSAHKVAEVMAGAPPFIGGLSDADILQSLMSIDWDFAGKKTDYFSHGLHPYPAKFIPQIPRTLISLLTEPGDLVWDPFGGSGTTALEAILLGRRAISTDVNPVAEVIGKAKTTTLTPESGIELSQFAAELKMLAESEQVAKSMNSSSRLYANLIPDIPNIDKWFCASAIQELAYLRLRISQLSENESKKVSLATFSKIILFASNQDEETRYSCVPKNHRHGAVLAAFSKTLSQSVKKLEELSTHLRFMEATFATLDLREPSELSELAVFLRPNTVDLVVTSPPYPNATDYHLYHRFRIFWLGHDPREMSKAEIGSHLRHQKQNTGFDSYLDEMSQTLRNIYSALKPGALAVFVVGDAVFGGKTFHTSAKLAEVAVTNGFRAIGEIARELPQHKRSFMSTARRLRRETLLVLRKPGRERRLQLAPPPYALQPYEQYLRLREIEVSFGDVSRRESHASVSVHPHQARQVRKLSFCSGALSDGVVVESTWQSILENGDPHSQTAVSKKRKDPKYVTHGIHPYKGKFYPQLAKALMNVSGVKPGQTVLDPFCGSGTVLLEAALGGFSGIGFDINPVAVSIANAKVSALHANPAYRDHLLSSFERRLEDHIRQGIAGEQLPYEVDVCEEIRSWFPESVVPMLGQVLYELDLVPEESTRALIRVLLSSIIREISHQDPRDLRIRRRDKPLSTAPVFQLLVDRCREARRRLRNFAKAANYAPSPIGHSKAHLCDSAEYVTSYKAAGLSEESVDLVLTSPPYATALPYIDTDRLSLLVCHGMNAKSRRECESQLIGTREIKSSERTDLDQTIEHGTMGSLGSKLAAETVTTIYELNKDANVGFRRKNTAALLWQYFHKMNSSIGGITKAAKAGASAFVVLGDTRTLAGGRDIAIRSGAVIQQQFRAAGWETIEKIPITVTRENVIHSKNSITQNDIYWFRKNL